MENNSEEKTFLKHFLNVGTGTIINIFLGLITTPIITRIVDPSEFGKFSIFNTYVDIALAICFLGLDNGIVRFFYNKEDISYRRSLLKICFVAPLLSALIMSFIFVVLNFSGVVNTSFTKLTIILLCAYVIVNIWDRFSTLLLRLTYKTKQYSICTVIQKVVYCLIIALYIVAIKKFDVTMLIVSSLLSVVASAVYASTITKDNWQFTEVDFPNNKVEVFKYSLPFIIYASVDSLLDSVDKLTIDAYCNKYDVGIYSSALAIIAIFITVKKIFDAVWLPMRTEHYVKDEEGKEFIQKANVYITLILFFIGINLILFKDLICYILGEEYRYANVLLPYLFLGQTMYSISDTTLSGIDYSKKSYLHVVSGVVSLVVDLVLNIILIQKIGIIGAALATCLALFVFYCLRTYFSTKNYYINYYVKKTVIMFVVLLISSSVSIYINKVLVNIISYLLSLLIFYILYKDNIKDSVSLIKKTLLNKSKKYKQS